MKFFIKENFNESLATCSGVKNSGQLNGRPKLQKIIAFGFGGDARFFHLDTDQTEPIYLFIYLSTYSFMSNYKAFN